MKKSKKVNHLKKYYKNMNFALHLKEALDINDVQVKELSQRTGISKNTLDNYLSGQKSIPNAENAVKIARELGVSVEYLVTGKNSYSSSYESKSLDMLINSLKKLQESDIILIQEIVNRLKK